MYLLLNKWFHEADPFIILSIPNFISPYTASGISTVHFFPVLIYVMAGYRDRDAEKISITSTHR